MKKSITLALSIYIAFVFLQSLPFKFSNSLETQHIFQTLAQWSGLPWFGDYGGYATGVVELIAAILLFTRFHAIGALIALGVISGAIFFHLFTPLGIVMPHFDADTAQQIGDDAGILFMMACGVWVAAAILIAYDLKKEDSFLRTLLPTSTTTDPQE